jgi:hypothetical protein
MPDGKIERMTTVVEQPTEYLPDAPAADLPMLNFRVETNDALVPDNTPVEQPAVESDGVKLGRLFGAKN